MANEKKQLGKTKFTKAEKNGNGDNILSFILLLYLY